MDFFRIYKVYDYIFEEEQLVINQDIAFTHDNSDFFDKIPVKTVNGNVTVQGCRLIDFKNFPKVINGNLNASYNLFSSLNNFPQVNGRVLLDGNCITSFKGICREIENVLSVIGNPLTTVTGAPIVKKIDTLSVFMKDTHIHPIEIEIYQKCLEKGTWNPSNSLKQNVDDLNDSDCTAHFYSLFAKKYGL